MKISKAYRNEEFLMGEDARGIRILCEYEEPRSRLAQHGVQRTIIFFGSARLRPQPDGGPDYCAQATALAERLAQWTRDTHPHGERYHLCSGGGPGIMEAIHAGGARVERGLNLGLNISLPFEQHLNPYVDPDQAFEFHYFFMRKFWFVRLARAAVSFPGGFGTLDELFELLTLIQTGKVERMPLVLFGTEFWNEVVNFEALARRGVISPEDLDLFTVTDRVDEAARVITEGLASAP